ncbi:condensation domain-containing protein [Shigella flexneri]
MTCHIANIYCTWLRGEPTLGLPVVTPFADVVEEYQQYRESEAWQRDAGFWRTASSDSRHRPRHFLRHLYRAQRLGRDSAPET